MIYFTSDTHFGHSNIIKLQKRPFKDIREMNNTLIHLWNSRVNSQDTIYILGDLFFRCDDPEPILKKLNGKKHLILGNHDHTWTDKVKLDNYFQTVTNYMEIHDGQRNIILCHYPLLTWDGENRKYMVHGHIHANTNQDFWELIVKRERLLNAGVEVNNFYPVTFDELLANNILFKEKHPKRMEEVY